jgi:hypothetical protein
MTVQQLALRGSRAALRLAGVCGVLSMSAAALCAQQGRPGSTVTDSLHRTHATAEPTSSQASEAMSGMNGFVARQRRYRDAQFLVREQIDSAKYVNLGDLLSAIRGASMGTDARGHFVLRFKPNCPARVLINGLELEPSTPITNVLRVDSVLAVEAYRPSTASFPMDFSGPLFGSETKIGCGVLAFWTT